MTEVRISGIWARSRPTVSSLCGCCFANWAKVKESTAERKKYGWKKVGLKESRAELKRVLERVFLNSHWWVSLQPQVTRWAITMCTWVGHCINLMTVFSFQLQVAGVDERLCSHSLLALISRSRVNIPVTYDPVMKGFAIPFCWKFKFLDWCLKCFWPIYFHSNPFKLSPLCRGKKRRQAWSSTPAVLTQWLAFFLLPTDH